MVIIGVCAPTYSPFDGRYICFKCHFMLAGKINSKYHQNNRMIKHQEYLEISQTLFFMAYTYIQDVCLK